MKVWDQAGIELVTPGSAVKHASVVRRVNQLTTALCGLAFSNSVDPDEMQHYAAFHMGLHCFQKYSFRGFPNTKGLKC